MTEGRLNALWVAYYVYLAFMVAFLFKALAWWGWDWALLSLVVLMVPGVLLKRIARMAPLARKGWGADRTDVTPER